MRGEGFYDIFFISLPTFVMLVPTNCLCSSSSASPVALCSFTSSGKIGSPFYLFDFCWIVLFHVSVSTGVEGDRQGGRRGSLDIKWRRSLLRMEDGKWSCFLFHSRFSTIHTYPVWYFGINWRTWMLMFHLLTNPIFNGVLHAKNISFITKSSKGRMALPRRMNFRKNSKRPLTPLHFRKSISQISYNGYGCIYICK